MQGAPGIRGPAPAFRPACAFLLAALLLAGCSAPPPTPEEAARALLASEAFRVARVEKVASEAPEPCENAAGVRPEWNRWIRLGIARASTVATTAGAVCRLIVEEVYRREAENWSHRAQPADSTAAGVIRIPVAVRSLVRVSEIRSVGRGIAEAAFEWQWRLNQAGQRLGVDTAPHTGWAQLVLDDSGWRAARMETGD